ncbi:MAG: hypothetical protein J6Z49_12165 [Kiritimatiellae bacterium]|nr:hypothetical protein [Kiritimatiellia bacterium]
MSRLDEIERRINERMAEIDRKINSVVGGGDTPAPQGGQRGFGSVTAPYPPNDASSRIQSFLAPLNPAFLRWKNEERGVLPSGCGLMPSPFDTSYFASLPSRGGQLRGTFEARYDMRADGLLPPVRDQGAHGTCWAHAAIASLETCIAKTTGEKIDLSENNMANLHGFFGYYNFGGNHNLASAYLLRWDGPVLERDDPYGHAGASRAFPPVKHVQTIRWIPPMRDASDTEGIKLAVKTLGAVWVGYSHTNDPAVLRRDTAAFYHGGKPPLPNHAVAVVGWDDRYPASNFAVPPPGDGAWIVRNSWGEKFGDAGYFYVSYHDSTFARSTLNVAYCGTEPVDNYDDILQYDYLGLITALGNGERGVAANIFQAHRDMSVEAAGFYVLAPGSTYRVSIRVGCEPGNPSSGTEAGVTTGGCEWAGYETVRLSSPVRVPSGTKFAVVVELTSPGLRTPFGVETWNPDSLGPAKVDADEGQSFFLCEGQWLDMTVLPKPGESVRPGMLNNFCCKAYVKFDQEAARAWKRFCNKCGTYTYTESSTGGKCRKCGAWL